jgi:hypothetical protein
VGHGLTGGAAASSMQTRAGVSLARMATPPLQGLRKVVAVFPGFRLQRHTDLLEWRPRCDWSVN